MQELINYHNNVLKQVDNRFYRFIYDIIDWDQRMIGVKGPRGTGKTTMMLQKIKFGLMAPNEVLYLNIEHPWFYTNTLFDTVTNFYINGGRYIFVDEVHKYENWSRELKVIYDGFPSLKIVFSASSALDIYHGESDLSRRAITYELPGLSFREYLQFFHNISLKKLNLEEILYNHIQISTDLSSQISIIPLFKRYLKTGYLPIFKGLKPELARITLQNIINTTINVDLQPIANLPPQSVNKLKRVLGMIAEITPYEPNISTLAAKLNISRNTVLSFLSLLEKANILNFLIRNAYGISALQKPDKIYLENPNLNYALSFNPNIGTVRETFFMNQLKNATNRILMPKKHDFLINESIIFEVGGTNKKVENTDVFIAMDDIETGYANTIPLWLFGLLY